LDLLAKVTADFPEVLPYRQGLATIQGNLGTLLLTGEPATAKQHLGKAVDLLDGLVAAEPTVPGHRRSLAHAHHNLGIVLEHTGEWTAAESHYRWAMELWTRLANDVPATPYYRYHLALDHQNLGYLLYTRGYRQDGVVHFRRTKSLWEPLCVSLSSEGASPKERVDSLEQMALLLANCPEIALRDPERSVFLSRKIIDREPRQERHWSTLGMAYYRAGDPWAALAALTQANRLRGSQDLADAFLLAMVYWRLGHKAHARQYYEKAARFMESERPRSEQLRRFDSETAALLGVEKVSVEMCFTSPQ
jgi:tetratricopeptide (TPR) repeat protein